MTAPGFRGDDPVRVLYVMGLGRSGSTVLDLILGNHPEVIGLGELRNLVAEDGLRNEYCACGELVPRCPFWSEVMATWAGLTGGAEPIDLWRVQQDFERTRNWPGLSAASPRPKEAFARYRDLTRSLLESIRRTSGKRVLLDSSKLPARALALSRIPGVDLRIVHLVRDGRGVAWSLKKKHPVDLRQGIARTLRPRPILRTALRWRFVNWLSERMIARIGPDRVRRLRYEDFVSDPVATLGRIGELFDLDLVPVAERAAAGEALSIYHAVAGNRLRMAGSVRLRLDEEWKQKLSHRDQRIFATIAHRPLRRYGYLD